MSFPITIFFTMLGLINVISTNYELSFDGIKPHGRIAIHTITLISSLVIAITITRVLLINII